MRLYYSPGACSLAPHIVVREAGLEVSLDKVNLKEKRTDSGRDYRAVNPQGAVPALELDNGEVLTENAAVLQYLAALAPKSGLAPEKGMPHWRLLETLNFIATELHKGTSPLFRKPSEEVREATIKNLQNRYELLERKLGDKPFLLGDQFTIADAYAFVILTWARKFEIDLSERQKLQTYFQRVMKRPAVRQALEEEGLPTG
ncbi:MAG TPA: glutathione transferase GstA [Vitreimonas sp.]|uniref:glutathione transferase GstA n=1 Tax=Vitreimonas sp. TaxID=3069702 RepID=UPI002D413869|nr:glutathione transferase GstA [Vitreimonas sp.]HYD87642.1 glutathione transferase GstA [Vitreimonas sp.]